MAVKYPARRRAVAKSIKDARNYRGISQRLLSERLGERDQFMHLVETVQKGILVEEFIAIALELDLDPAELLREVMKHSPDDHRRRRKTAGQSGKD